MAKRLSFSGDNDNSLGTLSRTSLSYFCIHPTGHKKHDFYVPPEFEEKILAHIFKNFVAHTCRINIPLILAIQGSQGDGKSSQVREVCSKNDIYIYPISGSFLSGSHEKEAVEILAESYINAYSIAKDTRKLITLLIDDFDLSVASTFENREYTVNSQLLSGFLMNIADDPTKCGKEVVGRIPIIVTGNNFTALYDPLTRHGRMDFFTWCPTYEQKLEIVKHMYASCLKKEHLNRIDQLVGDFCDEPISFFDSLKSDYLDAIICRNIRTKGHVKLNEIEKISKEAFFQGIDISFLMTLATRRKAIQRSDYIKHPNGSRNSQTKYLPS